MVTDESGNLAVDDRRALVDMAQPYPSSLLAMTTRWIWLVPS
jgi:hypothetical protein